MADDNNPTQLHQPKDEMFPGWGLPVNYMPDSEEENNTESAGAKPRLRFKNAIQDWNGDHVTVREILMMSVMRELMEKHEWNRKIFDEQIAAKWKDEALSSTNLSLKMWDYCLAEMQDKAKSFAETGIVSPIDFDCKVVYSDRALRPEAAQALSVAVAPLEDVPDKAKDWHPGSDDQVLDLVHPSLFPLIYGLSRVLPDGKVGLKDCVSWTGNGEVIPIPDTNDIINEKWFCEAYGRQDIWSSRFQWLPCDVSFCGSEDVRITSYINNLHPSKTDLYTAIEAVIAKSIPLWNEVLESTENTKSPRIDVSDYSYTIPERPTADDVGNVDGDDDEMDDWEREHNWIQANRVLNHPEPRGPYQPRAQPARLQVVDLRNQFAQKGLQVIVKLANIHLTPEKPTYQGGTWHIEGQLNEHIVATSLYYYDQKNIGDSCLAFRQAMDTEEHWEKIPYEQSDFDGVEEVLGIQNEEPAYSDLGRVLTKEGRLLAFPNVLQHRVPPFGLRDSTRPGHRKILALFLVDPYVRILSTSKVPPQQKEWWMDQLMATEDVRRFSKMPFELKTQILESVDDWPINLERAKEVRLELTQERGMLHDAIEEKASYNSFSFCEH